MNQAKHRLIDTDEPIKEIARQCGYRDPYFFSKDFKKTHRAPPYGLPGTGARPGTRDLVSSFT